MADLVTHLCTALLPGVLSRSRFLPAVVLGTVLPDLVSRVPAMALEVASRVVPVPDVALTAWGVLHEPLPLLGICAILSYAVVDADRDGVFLGSLLGCALHLGLDLLQDHHGQGYHLLFPIHMGRYELGWIGPQATVAVAPWLALITAVLWGIRAWRAR